MKFLISNIGNKIWLGGMLLIIFVFCFACQNAQTKNYNLPTTEGKIQNAAKKWIPGNYAGIEIGKSKKDDLDTKFGKPIWEGDEPLEGEEEDIQQALARNSGKRILLEYKNVGEMTGKTTVLIGEKNKIVQAIVLYPEISLTKEEFISKYSDDYVEKFSNESICAAIEKSPTEISTRKNTDSLEMLVFPEKGMYASLDENGKIDLIGFSLKCAN